MDSFLTNRKSNQHATGARSDRLLQGREACRDRGSRGIHDRICLPVKRLSLRQNVAQILHGFSVACHGPHVTLRHDAGHVLLRCCLDPHRVAVQQQQIVGVRLRNDSAADGEHDVFLAVDHTLETTSLDAAIARLAVKQKHLRQADTGFPLNLLVELHQRSTHCSGESGAEGRLACSAQANQGYSLSANSLLLAELLCQPPQDLFETLRWQTAQKSLYQTLFSDGLPRLEQV